MRELRCKRMAPNCAAGNCAHVLVELALDARRARGAVEEDQRLLAHVEPEDAAVPRLLELAREEDEAVEVALAGAVDREAVRRLHLAPVPHLRVDARARQRVDAVELVALHLQPGQHRRLLRAHRRAPPPVVQPVLHERRQLLRDLRLLGELAQRLRQPLVALAGARHEQRRREELGPRHRRHRREQQVLRHALREVLGLLVDGFIHGGLEVVLERAGGELGLDPGDVLLGLGWAFGGHICVLESGLRNALSERRGGIRRRRGSIALGSHAELAPALA